MTLQFWFWLLMVLALFFGLWSDYVSGQPYPIRRGTFSLLLFLILVILGWQVFGAPVQHH